MPVLQCDDCYEWMERVGPIERCSICLNISILSVILGYVTLYLWWELRVGWISETDAVIWRVSNAFQIFLIFLPQLIITKLKYVVKFLCYFLCNRHVYSAHISLITVFFLPEKKGMPHWLTEHWILLALYVWYLLTCVTIATERQCFILIYT